MYLGIDIGGTKTLVATLHNNGIIDECVKFPTLSEYDKFLEKLTSTIEGFTTKDFIAAGVGIPAVLIDRKRGEGLRFGNLPWHNASIEDDVKLLINCPVVVENDAKLAGLSESMLLKDDYKKVLYVTISTGIGFALVVNGVIDTSFGDGGGRTMLLEHDGKSLPWESFASGKAIVQQFGKRAAEITDAKTWRIISANLAEGLVDLIAIAQPEIIVLGGSVGVYYSRFAKFLNEDLKHFENALMPIPPIREAKRPEDAVVYGCYDLAKARYG